jgi:hypothetical protein
MNVNADKIIWTGNTLDELRRLLGGDIEIEFPEMMDRAGLDYPWPIIVKSVSYSSEGKKEEYVVIVLGFDEVPNASDYEVRISLVPAAKMGPPSDIIAFNAAGGYVGNSSSWGGTLSSPITAGDRCILAINAAETPSGMFSTWTKVISGTASPGNGQYETSIWIGSGIGTGTISVTANEYGVAGAGAHFGSDTAAFIYRNCGNLSIASQSVYTVTTGAETPMSAAALTTSPGQIAFSVVMSVKAFLDGWCPRSDGSRAVTGFIDTYSGRLGSGLDYETTAHGMAAVTGVTTGASMDASFDMVGTYAGYAQKGQVRNVVFNWSGV